MGLKDIVDRLYGPSKTMTLLLAGTVLSTGCINLGHDENIEDYRTRKIDPTEQLLAVADNLSKAGDRVGAMRHLKIVKNIYLEKGWFVYAAEIEEQLGNKEGATECYKMALRKYEGKSCFKLAARIALKLEDKKNSTRLYNLAIDECLEKEHFEEAAELAEEMGDKKKTNEYFELEIKSLEERNLLKRAAGIAKRMGDDKRAIRFYEQAKCFEEAGSLAKNIGDKKRAALNYNRADMPIAAAEIAEEAGLHAIALESYIAMKNHGKIYELAVDLAREARYERDYKNALKYFTIAAESEEGKIKHCYFQAAGCAEELLLFNKAKELYEKFAPDYFEVCEEEWDEFQRKAERAVSILFERGDMDGAVQTAGIVGKRYQLKICADIYRMRRE